MASEAVKAIRRFFGQAFEQDLFRTGKNWNSSLDQMCLV